MRKALIFDIQRFSIHDGPGIRTLIFLKGCPMRCLWCQNPEGINPLPEIGFYARFCIGCRECERVCPEGAIVFESGKRILRSKCTRCGICTDVCYAGALRLIGKLYTAEELLAEVRKDSAFYEASGGGITLSGGEPMLQASFLSDFLPLCKEAGFHTAIETSGYFPYEKLEMLLPSLDLILYDIKAVDPSLHRQLTGRDNALILTNLRHLIEIGAPLIIRMPIIPTLTAMHENLKEVSHFLKENGIRELHLLPYHPLGESKLEAIDSPLRPLGLSRPSEEELAKITALFEREGVEVRIGG